MCVYVLFRLIVLSRNAHGVPKTMVIIRTQSSTSWILFATGLESALRWIRIKAISMIRRGSATGMIPTKRDRGHHVFADVNCCCGRSRVWCYIRWRQRMTTLTDTCMALIMGDGRQCVVPSFEVNPRFHEDAAIHMPLARRKMHLTEYDKRYIIYHLRNGETLFHSRGGWCAFIASAM